MRDVEIERSEDTDKKEKGRHLAALLCELNFYFLEKIIETDSLNYLSSWFCLYFQQTPKFCIKILLLIFFDKIFY